MRLSFYGMVWLSLWVWSGAAGAQEVSGSESAPSPTADGVIDMEAVVVAGVQPGPGLWKVRNGDHLLYILGTQSPLPKNITWRSDEVDQVLQLADEVLASPGITVDADVGFFRGLTLLPSALKASKNPDGQKLQDVLPADLYARWSVLKQRYARRGGGIEKKRPVIAAYQLYTEALSDSGLREGGVIDPVIDSVLKQRKMKRTPTLLKLKLEDPREALTDFRKETLKPEDLVCFSRTLDVIERDLPQVAARANAWAVGDWSSLRSGARQDWQQACATAWFNTETARKRGISGVEARMQARWMEVVEGALQKNRITFATLPVWQLVKPDGYLAALQAKGYEVEAPE
ncbi:TraB/GumN family protein [Pseudoxanthomonas sp. LjRoot143]|uniref:TraB/GumN family protein n=1 Tax=Pseudoxanthomonas sp. LjRoot143 TaxID=3342266 RepID=UPI003ECC21AC